MQLGGTIWFMLNSLLEAFDPKSDKHLVFHYTITPESYREVGKPAMD